MVENLKVLQINLNKNPRTTESTLQLAIELKVDIIAIQEPWIAPSNSNNYEALRLIAY